ncbi:MAG: hypothetical protein R3Y09_02235 [Clostridia bacterium]
MEFEKKKFEKYLKEVEKNENSEYFRVMSDMNNAMVDVAEAIGKDKYDEVVDALDKYDEVLIKMVVEYMQKQKNIV